MKTDQNRLIMSMLSNGNGNHHGSSKSISPSSSSTGSLNLKKSFRIDDLLSKKSARYGSPSSNNHYSSNNSNNSEESLQENDGSPPEGVRSQNQSHQQYNHRRGDHEQDHHSNNNNNSHHQHFINSHNNTKNNSNRIEADYPQERDRERDRDRDRDRRGTTKMTSIVGKSDYPNQALITSRYSQSSDRDRERDRDRDRDHPGLLRPNNSYNNNNWEDEHHVNSLKLTELRKSYQQHHQQQQESSQQQATYSMGRYEFDPNHHHHHPQSVRPSSPGSGPGPTPPTIPLPPLYLPEALAPPPPLSFSSMSQLTHYQEALQRYNDYITANNNASQIQIQQNPFGFYSSPSPNNPLHHPALSMSTLSAFRSLYPSAGPGDPLASLSPDDLATARNSFSHSTNGLYAAASLAYLGRNPPSFSMPSLLGHNDGNKRKGGQIRFTNYQTSQLEKSFMDHKYLNANDRKKLATSLGLSDRQVKTWFQNRRAKWRKCKEIHCQDIEGEMNKCSSSDRQSYSPDPGNCESPATSGPEDDEHSP